MLPKLKIQALLRAVQNTAGEMPRSKAAEHLSHELGFGRIAGRRWLLNDADRERISAYLREVERIEPATPANAWQGVGRIDAARLGANEKLAGQKPRDGRVAVRAPLGLHLGLRRLELPQGSFLDLPVSKDIMFGHGVVIVVENFEAFIHYEAALHAPHSYTDPLLVYRGDAVNPPSAVTALLRRCCTGKTILMWPDFDPAGIKIATAMNNCAGVIAPADPYAALASAGRPDLFLAQQREYLSLATAAMDEDKEEWPELFDAMRVHRAGLDQETMIARQLPLCVWPR